MKLTSEDIRALRSGLAAAKLAGVADAVIVNGHISGVHKGHLAAIFSPISFSAPVSLGIMRLADFEKRLTLFGDDVLVELECADNAKVRKLNIKGVAGKIDFRCTDERLITYPKSNNDVQSITLELTRPEVALISKGAKTLGASHITIQIKKDGTVHIECSDTNQDVFSADISGVAVFDAEPHPYVNRFDATNNGVLLSLLEHGVKDKDSVHLQIMETGNIAVKAFGHDVFVMPMAEYGED